MLSRINKCASYHAFIAGAINRDSDDRYIHLVPAFNDLWLQGLQKSHSKALSNLWVYYFDLLYECMSSCFWATKSQLSKLDRVNRNSVTFFCSGLRSARTIECKVNLTVK